MLQARTKRFEVVVQAEMMGGGGHTAERREGLVEGFLPGVGVGS